MYNFDTFARARARAHSSGFRFLTTALAVGNAMLHAADTSHQDDARVRRQRRAQEEHDTVARYLDDGPDLYLTAYEREHVAAALAQLGKRLEALPSHGRPGG